MNQRWNRSRKWIAAVCTATLGIMLAASLLAPYLTSWSFDAIDLPNRLHPSSREHWLGTDELGRDLFTRLLYGGRVSFLVSSLVVTISFASGALLGMLAGFRGGWLDELLMRLVDVLLAFPGILLAIALMALLGPSLNNVILALVLIGWVSYARLARGLTLKIRELDFVNASRSLGASPARLLLVHVLPNLLPSLIVQASFGFAGMILAESALSFLGLGVQPPQPSWGSMLNDGKNHLLDAPFLTVFPGAAIFAAVLCWNLLGDALRDRLDPRWRA